MNDGRGTRGDGSRGILRALLDSSSDSAGEWSPGDLAAVLEHQLRTPLRLEADKLVAHADCDAATARERVASQGDATFADVLHTGDPVDGLLTMVKGYAKASISADGGLPRDVGRFLYIAAILRARSAGAESFSKLGDANIESEARRCLTLTWLPVHAKDLLRTGLTGA